jgi:hypothetical protein
LVKVLAQLPCGGIQNGSIVRIEDFSQDLEVDICITHKDVWEQEEGESDEDAERYLVGGDKPKPGTTVIADERGIEEQSAAEDEDVEILDMDSGEEVKPAASAKRKSETTSNGVVNSEPVAKKSKTEDGGIIVLD